MIVEVPKYKIKKKTKFFITTMLVGMSSNISLFLEHPFEAIKTQWQKRNSIKKLSEVTSLMYKETGIFGFYKGLAPNLIKASFRNLFRWPSMIYLPNYFKKYLEHKPFYFDSLPKVLTGFAIANLEVFILNPLERLKIFLMTEKSYASTFFKKHKGHLWKELNKGLGPSYWKTNMGWLSFILSNHYLKRFWKEYLGRKHLRMGDLLTISSLVGVACTLSTMPFDFLKTQAQMESDGKDNQKRRGTLRLLFDHFANNNLRVLYTGWHLRFSQTIINSFVAVTLLEKLETDFKKLH